MPESHKTDHDLLIELKTMSECHHSENQRTFVAHQKEDIEAFTELRGKINAAHTRIDKVRDEISGKLDALLSLKDKVLGGSIVVMAIFTGLTTILSLLKK